MDETQQAHDDEIMHDLSQPKTPREYLRIVFSGFAMGSVEVIPGVSGGTMAFILGIYETLINAIKSFNLDAARLLFSRKFGELINEHVPMRFLLALGIGMGVAILSLTQILDNLLENQPTFLFAFFGGLIIASIIAIGAKIRWSPGAIGTLIVGAVVAFLIAGVGGIATIEPGETADDAFVQESEIAQEVVALEPGTLTLFFGGMIAICALLLPGVSGSFILLILGLYDYVIAAVKNFDFGVIIPVGIGAVIGVLAFSRVISWLLKHYENTTIAALVGFMVGSLRIIWDRAVEGTDLITDFGITHGLIIAALILVGFLAVSIMDHMQNRSNPFFLLFSGNRAATVASGD